VALKYFNVISGVSAGNITLNAGNSTVVADNVVGNINSLALTANGNVSFTGPNVSLGNVSNLKVTGGSSGQYLQTDGTGNLTWAAGGGGGGTPGGSNTQVQFNESNNFAASANFTFDSAINLLTVNGNLTLGNITIAPFGDPEDPFMDPFGLDVNGGINANGNIDVGTNIVSALGLVVNSLYIGVSNPGNGAPKILTFDGGANIDGANINLANGAFVGNGAGLTNIASATTSGTVTTAAQPNITSVGNLTSLVMTGNITPSATNTYSLGNSTNRWDNLWLAGNTIYLGNADIKANATAVIITNPGGGQLVISGNGTASSNTIYNGTSNVSIPAANGNINLSAAGTANVAVVTGTGVNVTGTLNATGNITAPFFIGNGSQLTGVIAGTGDTIANGNSNITIFSTSVGISANAVANVLTVNRNGANVTGTLGTTGNVTANFFIGNGSQLTGVIAGIGDTIANGNSNITIFSTSVGISANAVANVLTVNRNGANVTGTLNATGNITANNLIGVLTNGGTSNITIASATGDVTIARAGTTRITATNTGADVTGTLEVTGRVIATGNISGTQLISNITTGTAPLVVSSTTVVANLNANALQGNAPSQTATANSITQRNANGNITANFFIGNGSQLTGVIAGTGDTIANGNSNITIFSTSVGISANAVANVVVVTATGANIAGTLNATGNANTGNLGTGRVIATGNISGTQLISNITTGTAPLVVSSTTVVANLNADLLDGLNTATANTANTVAVRDANGNIAANFFIGNGSSLSAIAGANVTGTVANATFATSAGSATTAGTVTTAAQPNITSVGTLASATVTGNVAAGNLTTVGSLSVSGTGNVGGDLTAANLTVGSGSGGTITGANLISANFFTGTLTTNAQPNITSVGTLTGLLANGNVSFTGSNVSLGNVSNLKVTGGSSGQYLRTDGTGNLTWAAAGGSSFLPMSQESGIDFTTDSAAFSPPLLFLTQGIAGFAQTITGVRVPMRAIGSGYTLEPCLYGGIDPATTTPSPSGATRIALGSGVSLTTANTIYSLPFTTPVVLTPGLVYYLGFSAHGGTGTLSLAALGSNRVEYFNSGTFNPPPNPAPSMSTFVANNCGWWAY
jgi:hypothetical protein